jgi:hypothetical protein
MTPDELLAGLSERIATWLDEHGVDGESRLSLTDLLVDYDRPFAQVMDVITNDGNTDGFIAIEEPDRESWDVFAFVFASYADATSGPTPGMVVHFDLSDYDGEDMHESIQSIGRDVLDALSRVIACSPAKKEA